MLRLFRNIRRNILSDNKFTRYFLYAIGEIALVVIGILVALQVNNWNEGRKQAGEEQVILKALYEEISGNQQVLKEAIGRAKRVEEAIYDILEYTGPEKPILTKPRSDSLINRLDAMVTAEVNQSILNDLLSTGRIHLIQNDSLKYKLTYWVPLYNDEVLEEEGFILTFTRSQIVPFLIKNYSIATEGFRKYSGYESSFPFDHREIYQSKEFENLVLRKELNYYLLMNNYETIIAYNEKLLQMIEGELFK